MPHGEYSVVEEGEESEEGKEGALTPNCRPLRVETLKRCGPYLRSTRFL